MPNINGSGIALGANFSPRFVMFLDDRQQFDTLADMKAFPSTALPDGLISFCLETRKFYSFDNTNADDTALGKWREFSGSSLSDTDLIKVVSVLPVASATILSRYYMLESDNKIYKCVVDVEDVDDPSNTTYKFVEVGNSVALEDDLTFNNEVGGIETNTTFPAGTVLDEIFKKMANKAIPAEVTLSSNLSTLSYVLGTVVHNGLTLTANVVKGSSPITQIEFFKDDVSVSVITADVEDGGNFTYANGADISSDVSYKVVVTDENGKTATDTLSVKFYNPYYYGISSKSIDDITATDITSLAKDISSKGKKEYTFTSNNERCVVAYPKSYGLITSVLDQNGFENVDSWIYGEIEISSVQYYVYETSTNVICENFNYTFNY